MKIIITGATGTAGSEVLRQALAHPGIEAVTTLVRRDTGVEHPKLTTVIHKDFSSYDAVKDQLAGHHACLWCLGISQTQVSADEYQRITHDYALAAARAFANLSPGMRFLHLSGEGADTTEKSRIRFGRVKGATENALLALGKPEVVNFRPAFIHPSTPRPNPLFSERIADRLAPVFYCLYPSGIIGTEHLAQAMLHVALHGAPKHTLSNVEIKALVPPPLPPRNQ
mmetsp:Transcript_7251/g.21409  ORF Transcript_7251/g.21409 Transcript_7251/m.21409 type:complete len:226 (-) Transcript_7251:559-1236(-)|eukprot:CAMPEP_0206151800 /NCGR_PEP_ID=MMETSP1473-20131121/39003_1 /ASSEMBLY_ACC=CAM_ASM_001109 /TAXON_ID=1461547 /ORGANISM="Stichococcus sp, Strain RCC1054" /LENGTH=225 /DNA_ID=CAMNT_0053549349 /DNA_START=143 /DNA_END=820 /DNA_ORIENTATION=-